MNAVNRSLLLLLLVSCADALDPAATDASARPTVIDGSFNPDLSAFGPYSLVSVLQPDGRILLAGADLADVNFRVTRLNEDGSGDPFFQAPAYLNSPASTNCISSLGPLALQPDGRILVAQNLMISGSNYVPSTQIIRLLSDGSLDPGFTCELAKSLQNNPVLATMEVWPDGHVFVAGDFSVVNGVPQIGAALLNSDGTVDRQFDPSMFQGTNVQASVADLTLQPDGKMLVGGSISEIAGVPRSYLARLNSDGSLDNAFNSAAASMPNWTSVGLVRLQTDGKILMTVTLTNLSVFETPLATVARLNPDGTLDEGFHPAAEAQADWSIDELSVRADGGVLIGGFVSWLDTYRVLLLNTDGSLNVDLTAGLAQAGALSNWTSPLHPDPLNRLVGSMKFPTPPGNHLVPNDNLSIPRFGRYFSDVTVPGVEFEKAQFSVNETSGAALINVVRTGDLTRAFSVQYATRAGTAQTTGRYIDQAGVLAFGPMEQSHSFSIPITDDALVNGDGTVLLELSQPSNGVVLSGQSTATLTIKDNEIPTPGSSEPGVQFLTPSIAVAEDAGEAMIVIERTGASSNAVTIGYSTLNGSAHYGSDFAASSGTVQFAPFETVKTIPIPVYDDLVAGTNLQFTLMLTNASTGVLLGSGLSTQAVVIHNAQRPGSVDFSFDPGSSTTYDRDGFPDLLGLSTFASQADGKMLLAGVFESLDGDRLTCLERLNSDGSRDTTFDVILPPDEGWGVSSSVSLLLVQPNGQILAAGDFEQVNGSPCPPLIRLKPDGSQDGSFNAATVLGPLGALALQTDGQILCASAPVPQLGFINSPLFRLNPDGSPDPSFDFGAGANDTVTSLLPQPDGKILIGGSFTQVQQISRNELARLNPDGALDLTFDPGTGAASTQGTSGSSVSSMALDAEGRILAVGQFDKFNGIPRSSLVRLNSDGSVDPTFSNQTSVFQVERTPGTLAIQPDGRILVGAESIYDRTTSRTSIARLNPDGTLDRSFDSGDGAAAANEEPMQIALQADGRVLVIGDFYSFDGVPRTGIVRLHGDPSLRFLRPPSPAPGSLSLSTLNGRSYVLESSVELRTWIPIKTNTATGFVTQWTDPGLPPSSHRFFRARELSPSF
jgi:uncharacterized delta-60 repeat protein